MPTICGGAGGVPKPGYQRNVYITAAAVEAATDVFLSAATAILISPLVAGITYDLVNVCGQDPPTDPVISALDIANALNLLNPILAIPAQEKLRQWFLSWYWYVVCQCAAGATPAAPTPSNPGDVSSVNPGLPGGPGQAPCWHVKQSILVNAFNTVEDFTPTLLPYTNTQAVTPGGTNYPAVGAVIPAGVQQISFISTLPQATSGTSISLELAQYDASGSVLDKTTVASWSYPNFSTETNTLTLQAGAVFWTVEAFGGGASVPNVIVDVTFFCAGQNPGTPQTPCCPPDPTLSLKIDQLIGLVQALWASTPAQLNSFAESTVHSGLSGNGSFVIGASTIAIKVQLTATSALVGEIAGETITYIDAGWIIPILLEAPMAGQRLLYSPQLMLLPKLAEKVGYTLTLGVTATITELTVGP